MESSAPLLVGAGSDLAELLGCFRARRPGVAGWPGGLLRHEPCGHDPAWAVAVHCSIEHSFEKA